MSMKVFLGGTIYPMAGDATTVEAVAVDGRTIVAVGSREAVLHQAGPGATVIDLQGQTLIPGFIDAHHHLSIAVLYEGAADCRQGSVRSIAEIQQRLQAAATTLPPDAWVIGYGYDAFMLSDRRHPTRHDLDAACPDHPVMLMHFSFHQCVANSKALALAGIGRASTDPTGGIIERQPNGLPNGILLETAMANVESLARHDLAARDADGFRARLRRYQTQLFAAGITRLADAAVSADLRRMYQDAKEAGDLRMPVVMMPVAEGGYLAHPWDCLDGPVTGEGSDELHMGPLKLIFDGGENCAVCLSVVQIAHIAGRTLEHIVRTGSLGILKAFSRGKLRWGRDGHLHSGIRHYPDDETAIKLAQKAADRGFSLAIHAMGNEAVAQALRVHSAVRQPRSDVPPPRIEHLTMADPALLTSLAGQGITAVVQPGFVDALTPALPSGRP
jgi:predicted amidohydrolase YtcJ